MVKVGIDSAWVWIELFFFFFLMHSMRVCAKQTGIQYKSVNSHKQYFIGIARCFIIAETIHLI